MNSVSFLDRRNRAIVALFEAVAVGLVVAVAAVWIAFPASNAPASPEAQAKAVARQFMRSLGTAQFGRTCRLLSARFYRENHVPSRKRCELALRVTFTGAAVRFKILIAQVDRDRNRAVVHALANGAPGKIVLVQERGVFKVLSVAGA